MLTISLAAAVAGMATPLALPATVARDARTAATPAAGSDAARHQAEAHDRSVLVRVAPAGRGSRAEADDEATSAWRERKIGRCLRLSAISGVRMADPGRLLLVMDDRRLIGAELEKACRARDFYSGFYVKRSADGRLCVGRDQLHARSGANCLLSRLRQLIEP